ncbi:uncharacterized protein L203_101124 [Cryptococcus depauperatus CBS 7841]|uniref:Uncharacterized protein n=1 Tax=Cryptococcus depauperatus CBS 7841 TaxID=1295531 RepID=A0A1E3IMS4_9TREE|nr:hypothetical protein L203_02407 [Cryptococcus depauperatus CBS 7841]
MGKWQENKYENELASKIKHLLNKAEERDQRNLPKDASLLKQPLSNRRFRTFVKTLDPENEAVQEIFFRLLFCLGDQPKEEKDYVKRAYSRPYNRHHADSIRHNDVPSSLPFAIPIADVPSSSRFPTPERRQRMAVNNVLPFSASRRWDLSREDPLDWSWQESVNETSTARYNLDSGVESHRSMSQPFASEIPASTSLIHSNRPALLEPYTENGQSPDSNPIDRPIRPLPFRGPGRRSLTSIASHRNLLASNSTMDDALDTMVDGADSQRRNDYVLQRSSSISLRRRTQEQTDENEENYADGRYAVRRRVHSPNQTWRHWEEGHDPWNEAAYNQRDTRRDGIVFDDQMAIVIENGQDEIERSAESQDNVSG